MEATGESKRRIVSLSTSRAPRDDQTGRGSERDKGTQLNRDDRPAVSPVRGPFTVTLDHDGHNGGRSVQLRGSGWEGGGAGEEGREEDGGGADLLAGWNFSNGFVFKCSGATITEV